VTAAYSDRIAFRENNGGGGGDWASQGAGPLYFGIGSASSATVTVNWPSGVVDTIATVPANSNLTIVEGSTQITPPTVVQQPRDTTTTVGQRATFKVQATGTPPLSYQWKKNGIDIVGAIRSKYVTPPVTTEDNGAKFSVVVSNSAGSVTSRRAKLTVVP
jgi:hypothetical protein